MRSVRRSSWPPVPTEDAEHEALAQYLDARGFLWCHVANEARGGARSRVALGQKMKRLGVKAGVPDVLIFNRPNEPAHCAGVAIELKRRRGGRVTKEQEWWGEELRKRGWVCEVCHGVEEAIELIEAVFPLARRKV